MKVLGIDYGKRKIGLALGDTETRLVEPLKVLGNGTAFLNDLQKLAEKNQAGLIVVGMTGGKIDRQIHGFADKVKKVTGLAVKFADETLTTRQASQILGQGHRSRKKKKELEDAIAAAVMLEYFLN